MVSLRTLGQAIYKAAYNTVQHDGIEHAGYLAFLGILSLFPFLVFIVALAGFFGQGEAGSNLIKLIFSELPPHMIQALEPRVAEIISGPPQGLLTVSILGAIWTASSAVEGYRTVLNRAYHVATPPAYIWRRMLSIVQILVLSFVAVVAMMLMVMLPIVWERLAMWWGGSGMTFDEALPRAIGYGTTVIIFSVVCLSYYILPNIKQNFHSVAPGAAIVTCLWLLSARLLSGYLSNFDQVNLIYGSLGGVIAALLFLYISNIIFIYGAELNYLIKKALGEKIEQKTDIAA